MSRDNGPAYPATIEKDGTAGRYTTYDSGMTIREHIAGLALQGLLASEGPAALEDWLPEVAARSAVRVADALLAELAGETGEDGGVTASPNLVWRFCDAPPELQALSRHGGDEDWLAVLPQGDEFITWIEGGSGFGVCDVSTHKHPNKKGWVVKIGAHA